VCDLFTAYKRTYTVGVKVDTLRHFKTIYIGNGWFKLFFFNRADMNLFQIHTGK